MDSWVNCSGSKVWGVVKDCEEFGVGRVGFWFWRFGFGGLVAGFGGLTAQTQEMNNSTVAV